MDPMELHLVCSRVHRLSNSTKCLLISSLLFRVGLLVEGLEEVLGVVRRILVLSSERLIQWKRKGFKKTQGTPSS